MRDIEELSDDESHIEDRGTKVKDFENRSLTTEERDRIIREYNAKHSGDLEDSDISVSKPEKKIVTHAEDIDNESDDTNYEELMKRDPRLYSDEELTTEEIAKKFGFKTKTLPDIDESFWTNEDESTSIEKEVNLEDVRKLYLEDGLSLKKIGAQFGHKSGEPIKRILETAGVEIRPVGFQKIEIDPEEVIRLFKEEELSIRKIGEHFGVSFGPICRILKEHNIEYGQKIQDESLNEEDRKEPSLEEVRELYLEDGLSLKKIGEQFGFKSGKPIKRILEAAEIEIRPVGFQKIEIDPDEVHRLYFDEKWDLKDVVAHFDCKSSDPIHRVFKEHGWKTRQQVSYQKEIDPEEVFRLYNEEGLSLRNIGKHFGVSDGPIRRIFKEHDVPYGQEIPVNPEALHYFYFELGLSKEETCEALGISKKPFDRILDEQGWNARSGGFQPVDIDIEKFKKLYYDEEIKLEEISKRLQVAVSTITRFREKQVLEDRVLKYGKELRDEIFGTECRLCRKPYELIHKKDGKPHKSHIVWSRKSLLTLNPDEWAALCWPCHRVTHALMNAYGFDWNRIERIVKESAGNCDS